jgi:hypothetical protein
MRSSNVTIVTTGAALAGGLVAVLLISVANVELDLVKWVLLVIGATALASAIAILMLTSGAPAQASPQAPPGRDGWPQRPPHPAPPRPNANVPRAREPQATPGVQVVALDAGGRARDWWNKSGPAGPPAGDHRLPAPELASYVASGAAFVAQCPNCGDFRIDMTRGEPAHSFQCRNPDCGARWRWTPGTDWPAVVVRRNLTARQPGPDHR